MKKTIFMIMTAVLALFSASAEGLTKNDALSVLKKVDENTSYMGVDFKADYVMVQEKPGGSKSYTNATMYRRDSKSMYTILITGPEADKGKGYVQYDNNIWMYDPHDRQFTYTSAKNRFNNTNLNNGDLAPQNYSKNYTMEKFGEVKLGKYNCVYFELKATAKNVEYPIVKLWVSKDDNLLRKREDYSLSEQLLRTTAIPSYQPPIQGHVVPAGMLVIDNLRGQKIDGKMQYEKTQITVSNVSFQKQGDIVYSKQFLENMSL